MRSRYKAIISNKNFYKEIDFAPETEKLSVGTYSECDVRLHKELFFCPVELVFTRDNDEWIISCSDGIYISSGDVRKLITQKLKHGDEFVIKYQDSDNMLFNVSFMIDFDYEKKDYNREIEIPIKKQIKIGGNYDSDICICDGYLGTDYLVLTFDGRRAFVEDAKTRYGVYVNGVRINRRQEIKNTDFFAIVGYSFFFKDGKLYTSSTSNVVVNGLNNRISEISTTNFVYPKFNRNTRVQYVVPNEEMEIQQPPQKPQQQKKSLIMSLIPSLATLALTVVLRGIIGGGGTFVIYSAISMSIGIIMSIVTFMQDRKSYKKECLEREETYNQYIDNKKKSIEESRKNELRIRNLIYESIEKNIDEVKLFGKRLFERSKDDPDFLHIYLGKGKIESANQVKYTKQEFVDLTDPLQSLPETISESYRYIEEAPIVSDFNNSCGIGIVGNKDLLKQMLTNITLDIAIRHFYSDVKFVYILSDDFVDDFEWVKWLHNIENEQLDVRNIICDEESKNIILENLYLVLSGREAILNEANDYVFEEQYVVYVTDVSAISSHPVSKYIKDCIRYGFTFVFFEEYEEFIPQGCTEIIRVSNTANGKALKTKNGDIIFDFRYPEISTETALDVSLRLGAISVDEVTLESELTKNITLFELLGIFAIDDLNLTERWASSAVHKSLAAPLGVKNKAQVVYLDISDKSGAHGPHGLVAGTTGSGKSEILQTYILSMASLFHPYEVGFVIIDFKGGGMANQFKNLPHLIGTITNIDGREINRSLLSIKAELVKRQEMFSESGVNHINDYIRLYKAKKVDKPLPHLIMIVDEFAELKAEYPDFMKELISAARIGRTLGVHLILATQKPSGVVDAQIWSNSKFKLCLKVQTKEDSNEVIKTPLAAEIVEPGRAYFQVGNNEIFELFQSAYSGAQVPSATEMQDKVFNIYERNLWGKKSLKYTNKQQKKDTEAQTQLQAVVDYVHDYCVEQKIVKLPGICLPSLKDKITVDSLSYEIPESETGIIVPFGICDDPEQQKQDIVSVELSKDNMYLVGSSQSGKTVMLQTIIYGLIKKYTPSQVNLYLVDCGSMVLRIFENSAHVGGVVLSNEEEKCKNLFKLLNTLITQRKKILSAKGIGTYSAYIDAGYTDMPMVIVAIDNMAAFKEYFPNQNDEINSLSREALSVGISFIVTAATTNALSYRTQANFGKKFILNCNDPNEYSNMFGHCKIAPKENAGRGLLMLDKRVLEFQTAIFGKSDKEAPRSDELKAFIESENKKYSVKSLAIPMIPEKLVLSDAIVNDAKAFRNSGIIPIGMDFATVELTSINMNNSGSLALMGDYDCREKFLLNLLKTIAQTIVFHNIEAIVIDDKQRRLSECESFGFVKHYTSDISDGLSLVNEYCDDLSERISDEDEEIDNFTMLIINNPEVFKRMCADRNDSKMLSEAIRNANEAQGFIILSTVENQNVSFNASDVLKAIKEERNAVLFAPIAENKMFDVSGRPKAESFFDNTMGYRFYGGSYSKIKIFN